MMVYLCVEGRSDCDALKAALGPYIERCRPTGWGIRPIRMKNKVGLLSKIGEYANARLSSEDNSHVIAMPDLYPTHGLGDEYDHSSYEHLQALLTNLVGVATRRHPELMRRFHPFPFCYDMEVLLLALPARLRTYLRTPDNIQNTYTHPAEKQDDQHPPKYVVSDLFRTKHHKKIAYKDTAHAPAILRGVSPAELKNPRELPNFTRFLETLEQITGVLIQ